MSEPLVEREGTIVVGTSLDAASAIALRRAVALSKTFEADIRVVFSVPRESGPLRVTETEERRRVVEWAKRKAHVVLDPQNIVCRLEDPATALAHNALGLGASLVVIGASRTERTSETAERLLRLAPVRVLLARTPRHRDAIVAATDLRDKRFPIAHAAAAWASAYDARVTLIHNLESLADARLVSRKQVWPALRDLLHLTRALRPVKRAHLSRGSSTPEAISQLARTQAADLVVVGARRPGSRTMSELLTSSNSSVLVVPLRDRSG